MDLSKMSLAQLRELNEKISWELDEGARRQRETAVKEIMAVARSVGMSIQEILKGNTVPKDRQGSQAQRYVDPVNPSNVWGGMGPRPAWLKAALAAGVPIDQLRAQASEHVQRPFERQPGNS